MTDEERFQREPDDEFTVGMLCDYQPKTAEQLTEWLMMCANGVLDKNGLRMPYKLPPYVAWQMARMMQITKLEVPND
jgi:hypothetical protein